MTSVDDDQRRICVEFAGDYPPMYFQADSATAQNISDAFAENSNPVVTVDDQLSPSLRIFLAFVYFNIRRHDTRSSGIAR